MTLEVIFDCEAGEDKADEVSENILKLAEHTRDSIFAYARNIDSDIRFMIGLKSSEEYEVH